MIWLRYWYDNIYRIVEDRFLFILVRIIGIHVKKQHATSLSIYDVLLPVFLFIYYLLFYYYLLLLFYYYFNFNNIYNTTPQVKNIMRKKKKKICNCTRKFKDIV